jgi:hypothetical protein
MDGSTMYDKNNAFFIIKGFSIVAIFIDIYALGWGNVLKEQHL